MDKGFNDMVPPCGSSKEQPVLRLRQPPVLRLRPDYDYDQYYDNDQYYDYDNHHESWSTTKNTTIATTNPTITSTTTTKTLSTTTRRSLPFLLFHVFDKKNKKDPFFNFCLIEHFQWFQICLSRLSSITNFEHNLKYL